MATAGFVIGIFAICGAFIGILPFLGWTNWLVIPLAVIGAALAGISLKLNETESRTQAIIGLVLCLVAAATGVVKITACGGFL